ncbi:DUF1592 domain-containing protein [Exilibacterium tricleocarpae]|nr:DUF1592 domain-containing protein [Exilibacterium tricleocarpae]
MNNACKRSLPARKLTGDSKRISRGCAKAAIALVGALYGHLALASNCQYTVIDDWSTGFKAEVTFTNDTDATLNNWNLSWTWSDGSNLNHGWQATYDCSGGTCSATPPSWFAGIPAGQSYTIGFVGNKGTPGTPTQNPVTVNGEICSDSVSSNVLWKLDGSGSSLQYVSMKKDHIAEINTFVAPIAEPAALDGSIDSGGNAILSIDLNDVATEIDIRNERMVNFVFETEFLPTAYITASIDIDALTAMAVGTTRVESLQGSLSLHGIRQDIATDVLVVKRTATDITVSTLQPILIDSKQFDMASGLETLKTIANLTSIGQAVPVYLRLHYVANTDPAQAPVAMPAAPAAPGPLAGDYDPAAAEARLTWQDNSDNESRFILRRKTPDGLWQTTANLLADTVDFSEGLPDAGEFDYKVIAINNSVPSAASNTARVVVSEGDPIARGRQTYGEQCAGCHGADAGGTASFPALNTPRDLEIMIEVITTSMPRGNPGACDEQCAQDVAAYIQTLWVTEVACDRTLSPVSYGARQLKILTKSEYQRSVEDLLGVDFDAAEGLSADEKVGFFFNNTHASIVASSYSNYLIVAEQIADWAAARDFSPALNCSSFNQDCADSFINDLAPAIIRRPLDSDEIDTYAQMANGSLTGGNVKDGIEMALEAILSSPQFLYRHELGEPNPANGDIDSDAFELTSYEMATFLAYTFTGSTPDQQLLAAAANDELRSEIEIMSQARRLAESAGAKLVMGDFVGSWLGTANLDIAAKNEDTWPGFLDLVPHMQREINEMFASVMLDPTERFASLYAADYTFVNQTLAAHYGIANVSGDAMQKVTTSDRGGILANGAFMARWGEAVETSPILRSVRVRRRMLCQDQPPPPAGTFAAREQKLAELSELLQDPSTTNRLKYHRLTEDQPCTNCHLQYINPLGFGMEDFDTVGRVRTADLNGNAIDASGELFAPNSYSNVQEVEPFQGSRGLGQLLATLPSAQACLPKQMFRYVVGVGYQDIDKDNPGRQLAEAEKSGYACEIDNLVDSMINENPRSMLERFSTLEAVRYRKAWARD